MLRHLSKVFDTASQWRHCGHNYFTYKISAKKNPSHVTARQPVIALSLPNTFTLYKQTGIFSSLLTLYLANNYKVYEPFGAHLRPSIQKCPTRPSDNDLTAWSLHVEILHLCGICWSAAIIIQPSTYSMNNSLDE